MNDSDKLDYIRRYEDRLSTFGYDPRTLGWGKTGRQAYRFKVLSEYVIQEKNSSVLDVGCGFADLYSFLSQLGWTGKYSGIDIVPGLVEYAKQKYPHLNIRNMDIADLVAEHFDFVVASGIFNAKLSNVDNKSHIENTVQVMFRIARNAVCIDFMTTNVDFQHETAWHTDPAWAVALARKNTRRFILRNDYMPFEFALFLFKDNEFSEKNIFKSFEKQYCEIDNLKK